MYCILYARFCGFVNPLETVIGSLPGGCGRHGFAGGASESIADRDGEGAGDKIDIGEYIEFGFPVEGEVDGGVWEFIIHADDACGAEPGLSVLEAYVAATAIEPVEAFIAADELVSFIQTAESEAGAPADEAFHGISLVEEIFYTDGIAKGRVACT